MKYFKKAFLFILLVLAINSNFSIVSATKTENQSKRDEVVAQKCKHENMTYTKYNSLYHTASCNCGYNERQEHYWSGGNVSAHRCTKCKYVHWKSRDETSGRHYFDLEKITKLGNVAPCVVCKKYLNLRYSSDSILPTLPKKEEYTMVGNPNPMKEVYLDSNQKIIANFMPINSKGEIIMLDPSFLRVRTYTNGNYYRHYSRLVGNELSKITNRVEYFEDPSTGQYIANELSSLGALGGYNEERKQEVIDNVLQMTRDDPNLKFLDVYAVTSVISKLGDFAINAINSPLLEWFSNDYAIKNTWLSGGITTLRHDFNGSKNSTAGREYTVYFSELPAGKYEIVVSPILTYGINFNLFGYSLGGVGQLMYSTLFNKGGGSADSPSNILGYISIGYRDNKGNVIYAKDGRLATPKDTVISKVVYSGTSAKSVRSVIDAQLEWTQLSGYRYKGYLIKYGNSGGGTYKIYNNPSEMIVSNDSSVEVISSFTPSRIRY